MKTRILKMIRRSFLLGALFAALYASSQVAYCQEKNSSPVGQTANRTANGAIDLKLADKMVMWMGIASVGSLILYILPGIFELRKYKKPH